jgi:hypothetical protein
MTKYKARKVKTEDGTFDSKAEYKRWCALKLLERADAICDLRLHPKFDLIVNGVNLGRYEADFGYYQRGDLHETIEDVKGVKTPVYRLKKKLMRACHGIEIQEVQA